MGLAGADDEIYGRVLSNTSARVRASLEEEITFLSDEERGPISAAECAGQQTAIANQLAQMAKQQKLNLPQ